MASPFPPAEAAPVGRYMQRNIEIGTDSQISELTFVVQIFKDAKPDERAAMLNYLKARFAGDHS